MIYLLRSTLRIGNVLGSHGGASHLEVAPVDLVFELSRFTHRWEELKVVLFRLVL